MTPFDKTEYQKLYLYKTRIRDKLKQEIIEEYAKEKPVLLENAKNELITDGFKVILEQFILTESFHNLTLEQQRVDVTKLQNLLLDHINARILDFSKKFDASTSNYLEKFDEVFEEKFNSLLLSKGDPTSLEVRQEAAKKTEESLKQTLHVELQNISFFGNHGVV